jgi:carboxymethylenebutenolidase
LQISVNEGLDATVIYYGNLIEDKDKLNNINSPVLGIFGSKDAQIPVDKINLFQKNLSELGIQNDIKIYDGVGHAFANPTGQNFSPNETKDAWSKTLEFLNQNLK